MKVGGINKVLPFFIGLTILSLFLFLLYKLSLFTSVQVKEFNEVKREQEISIDNKYIYYDVSKWSMNVTEEPLEKNPFSKYNDTVVIVDKLDGYVKFYRNVYADEVTDFYDQNYNYPHKWVESMPIEKFKKFVKKI